VYTINNGILFFPLCGAGDKTQGFTTEHIPSPQIVIGIALGSIPSTMKKITRNNEKNWILSTKMKISFYI
jgi:hypothetical protein